MPGKDEPNYDSGGFRTGRGDEVIATPGQTGDASVYDTWDWKQIQAGIIGSADYRPGGDGETAMSSISNPIGMLIAADTFQYLHNVLATVANSLVEQAEAVAGGDNAPWRGEAAGAFLTMMRNFAAGVRANAEVVSGGDSGMNSIPRQLFDNAFRLMSAAQEIWAINQWYSAQARERGAVVIGGLTDVAHVKQIPPMMTNDMRRVLHSLASNYAVTIDTRRDPQPVVSPLADLSSLSGPGGAGTTAEMPSGFETSAPSLSGDATGSGGAVGSYPGLEVGAPGSGMPGGDTGAVDSYPGLGTGGSGLEAPGGVGGFELGTAGGSTPSGVDAGSVPSFSGAPVDGALDPAAFPGSSGAGDLPGGGAQFQPGGGAVPFVPGASGFVPSSPGAGPGARGVPTLGGGLPAGDTRAASPFPFENSETGFQDGAAGADLGGAGTGLDAAPTTGFPGVDLPSVGADGLSPNGVAPFEISSPGQRLSGDVPRANDSAMGAPMMPGAAGARGAADPGRSDASGLLLPTVEPWRDGAFSPTDAVIDDVGGAAAGGTGLTGLDPRTAADDVSGFDPSTGLPAAGAVSPTDTGGVPSYDLASGSELAADSPAASVDAGGVDVGGIEQSAAAGARMTGAGMPMMPMMPGGAGAGHSAGAAERSDASGLIESSSAPWEGHVSLSDAGVIDVDDLAGATAGGSGLSGLPAAAAEPVLHATATDGGDVGVDTAMTESADVWTSGVIDVPATDAVVAIDRARGDIGLAAAGAVVAGAVAMAAAGAPSTSDSRLAGVPGAYRRNDTDGHEQADEAGAFLPLALRGKEKERAGRRLDRQEPPDNEDPRAADGEASEAVPEQDPWDVVPPGSPWSLDTGRIDTSTLDPAAAASSAARQEDVVLARWRPEQPSASEPGFSLAGAATEDFTFDDEDSDDNRDDAPDEQSEPSPSAPTRFAMLLAQEKDSWRGPAGSAPAVLE